MRLSLQLCFGVDCSLFVMPEASCLVICTPDWLQVIADHIASSVSIFLGCMGLPVGLVRFVEDAKFALA